MACTDAPGPGVLTGRLVRLEPLTTTHGPGLAEAAAESRDAYGYTWVPDGPAATAAYVDELLAMAAGGDHLPFVQVRPADDRVVGATSLGNLRPWPDGSGVSAAEIGWTWLAASAQRSGINREAKLLLMTYAFETLEVARVDLKTDRRNERSRQAIASLGATFEGVLRSWSPSWKAGEDGLLRDSAMFSVVASEWPDVKANLVAGIR